MGKTVQFPQKNKVSKELMAAAHKAAQDIVGDGYALVIWDGQGNCNVNFKNTTSIPAKLLPELIKQAIGNAIGQGH